MKMRPVSKVAKSTTRFVCKKCGNVYVAKKSVCPVCTMNFVKKDK